MLKSGSDRNFGNCGLTPVSDSDLIGAAVSGANRIAAPLAPAARKGEAAWKENRLPARLAVIGDEA
jgi:hypothetical protein